jgi:predicted RNase H-like nuclease (RuvC/YqgF family)
MKETADIMTEKELHKLRKQDLLQLLLAQGREAAELQEQITKLSASLEETEAGNERLKAKLDEKDELIEKLKSRLDEKDARITKMREIMRAWRANRQIELEEAGSIAEAALKLNKVFEAAQKAADQYIYNLRQRCEKKDE